MRQYHSRSFQVTRILDGDTLEIDAPDGDAAYTRVRILGVDAPETEWVTPEGEIISAQPLAAEAKALVVALVLHATVRLELDPDQTRGHYGRLLAYVVLDDGTRVGEHLLTHGLAQHDLRWPHPHADRYQLLQLDAQRAGRGRWADP